MRDLSKKTIGNNEATVVDWKVDRMTQIPHDAHIPTEVISVRGKLYEVQGRGKAEDYEQFFDHADTQGTDYVVVPDFTSDKHLQPTFTVLVPASAEGSPISGIIADYQNAVRQANQLALEERRDK